MAELADATDSKSVVLWTCGFKSHSGYLFRCGNMGSQHGLAVTATVHRRLGAMANDSTSNDSAGHDPVGLDFDETDIASLESKIGGLDLSSREQAAFDLLVAVAEQACDEVSGFVASPRGGLQFLLDFKPPTVRDGSRFASDGGLGGTRIAEDGRVKEWGGGMGDEIAT